MQMNSIASKDVILKQTFGYDSFREGQEPLIDALCSGRDALGVMPTDAGKSICYQIPALLLPGITLVISPLISLMKDQVMALKAAGVAGAYINSSLPARAYPEVLRRAADKWYKIIYVAPERLDTESFLHFAQNANISALIVDEAHCISQWGQDFRPSYLKIADFIDALPRRPVVGAFTATATERVRRDIVQSLQLRNPMTVVTSFDRPNLYFSVWKRKNKYSALTAFLEERSEKSGIIYCATRKTVEEVCSNLVRDGYAATRYHAGLEDEERRKNQDDFQYDRKTIMVATNAFGMGIDKSNGAFVVHYNMPANLEAYYQEAGRAGRDGEPADCLLLYAKQDVITAKWLLQHGNENADLTVQERQTLEDRNLEKLKQMTFYATTGCCFRNEILRYFGEYKQDACGHCGNCCEEQVQLEDDTPARRAARKRASAPGAATVADYDAVYSRLRILRSLLAAQEHVPAYVVFTDATLAAMAQYQPRTMEAFGEIIGVGAAKREKYGPRFLACIKDATHPDEADIPDEPVFPDRHHLAARPVANYRERLLEKGITEAYQPWTNEENAKLRNEFRVGLSVRQLAEEHGRTAGAIRARLKKLGLR